MAARAAMAGALIASCAAVLTSQAQHPVRFDPACTPATPPFSSPYCSELVPVPGMRAVRGVMQLVPVVSPLGAAVDAAGRPRVRARLTIDGLAAPARGAYIAWAYTLTMDEEQRLGAVRNGRNDLPELPFSQFRVIVSEEPNADTRTRRGKLLLRATSPSALLLAHRDLMAPLLTGTGGAMEHAAHGPAWPVPAADPRITPTPGMGPMAPNVAPETPEAGGAVAARARTLVRLSSGDTLTLTAMRVARRVGGKTFVLYGYNAQIPGPLISVPQGAQIVVRFVNAIAQPSTIHWHGVRLENRFDGTPHVTQEPVAPGDSFTYRVRFPDAGVYWYHPHVREDMQQDLGLYGNIVVRGPQRRRAAHREEVLALDDLALDSAGNPLPHGREAPTHALMGRFGNLTLVNGEPLYTLGVRRGEVVRFYLTNVANARLFNVSFRGARTKLVGSDMGNFERETFTTHVPLAPAERYIVDVLFDTPGRHAVVNHVQWLDHALGTYRDVADTLGIVHVSAERLTSDLSVPFNTLRSDPAVTRSVAPLRLRQAQPPDRTLTLGLRLGDVAPAMLAMLSGMSVPVDWNDGMPRMHWALTGREVTWTIADEGGRENMDIVWRVPRGTLVKLRIVNRFDVAHAMAHPIHLHGQRFVVLARNGVPNENLAWKDTALLPAGETMDLVVEMSNPGRWMLHCHIAEHLGTGMMMVFEVEP
ncbi:MAG: multicopper oxidase family protein, partial [Gemmatimonadaceae bacterium]